MLRQYSELYARRAREFSEAVASLGEHRAAGPQLVALLQRIERLRLLCNAAAKKLNQFVESEATEPATQQIQARKVEGNRLPLPRSGMQRGCLNSRRSK